MALIIIVNPLEEALRTPVRLWTRPKYIITMKEFENMSVNVQQVKESIFNFDDECDLAYSFFEVINTLIENEQDLAPEFSKTVD